MAATNGTSLTEKFKVIDTDTHLIEPPDLWTARMPAHLHDQIPRVRWDEHSGLEAWFLGDVRLNPIGSCAQAGWKEFPPLCPPRFTDAEPATWDAKARLAKMDEYGIWAQVLYPNVALFNFNSLQKSEPDLKVRMIQVYNDYQTEWSEADPERLLPATSLPFFDLDASLKEMERCADIGHKGIIFCQKPEAFGLPHITDPHWEPLWSKAEEIGHPICFHIADSGVGDVSMLAQGHPSRGIHANYATVGVGNFVANINTIANLVCSGLCHRHPDLNFISVESGIGWIPFGLKALDWQWRNCGVVLEHPEYELLPSEYFKRQIYGCFWFETETAYDAIDILGEDNVLYETDFPHPTSMSPGPASGAISPQDFLDENFSHYPDHTMSKILHDNAARIFKLD
jgi:predicted TIM-barrel fold metal-dependent hydrolase